MAGNDESIERQGMDVADRVVEELVARFLELRKRAEEAKARLDEAEANRRSMAYAPQYESYAEYREARRRIVAAEQARNEARDAYWKLSAELGEVERALIGCIGALVWVRFGDVGIGVAYTDWGERRNYIEVRPWQEKMPSLDHSTRGD